MRHLVVWDKVFFRWDEAHMKRLKISEIKSREMWEALNPASAANTAGGQDEKTVEKGVSKKRRVRT